MYVWQMHDGSWRVSLRTGYMALFGGILASPKAYALYRAEYEYESQARRAEQEIRDMLWLTVNGLRRETA